MGLIGWWPRIGATPAHIHPGATSPGDYLDGATTSTGHIPTWGSGSHGQQLPGDLDGHAGSGLPRQCRWRRTTRQRIRAGSTRAPKRR